MRYLNIILFLITSSAFSSELCNDGNLEIVDVSLFSELNMPNCTTERPMSVCKCTKKLEKFLSINDKIISNKKNQSLNDSLAKNLIKASKVKLTSIIYDLNYANNFLNINKTQREELVKDCNMNALKSKLVKCNKESNLIKSSTDINTFIKDIQEEGKHLLSNKMSSQDNAFFNRSNNKNLCPISDKEILQVTNYKDLYYLLDNNLTEDQKTNVFRRNTPLGFYIKSSPSNIKEFRDIQDYVNSELIKNEFLENFKVSCKSAIESVSDVLCASANDNHLSSPGELNQELNLKKQKYADKDFNSDQFMEDQLTLISYCEMDPDEKNNSSYQLNKNKVLEGMHGVFSTSVNDLKDFDVNGYQTKFEENRRVLCKNRPVSYKKLEANKCSLEDFSHNFNNVSSDCPLLVVDYILNTPTEELETQNIDKNLLAYKKTIEENKKSNGGDLILDFLGVSTPQEIASFKEAGIERSSSSNSNNDSNTKKNSVSANATAQTKTPTTYGQINQAFTGQGASQAGLSPNGQPNYQSAQTYHAMTAQEQNKVSEVERELMRRLMGSKVSESTNAAKAEMYEKYSKEMMELAKEKARLESSGSSASDKDLASYEKKMQDLVNQMREDNKKIADAQKGNSSDNSKTAYINNFQGNSNDRNGSETSSFGGSGESASSGGVVNANLNRALNETVNADKYAELTGKKPNQESNGATRSIASDETGLGLALIENNKLVAITSLEEIFSKKIKEKKPFVIAQKDNPSFKVRITPDKDNKVTITPLGNLSDPRYKNFYEEIEESFKTDKELQKYHRKDLVESFSAIQK